jgi:hypothetical protein
MVTDWQGIGSKGPFYFVVHPSWVEALRGTPKERWKAQHRQERMARKGRTDPVTVTTQTWEGVRIDG